mmetsp:Transcript_96323/g.171158  ORF Transcript_96323/g.171158 Transcript_96323/m.171158 type:complete len:133 (+) Transcript_96323:104-502(+)
MYKALLMPRFGSLLRMSSSRELYAKSQARPGEIPGQARVQQGKSWCSIHPACQGHPPATLNLSQADSLWSFQVSGKRRSQLKVSLTKNCTPQRLTTVEDDFDILGFVFCTRSRRKVFMTSCRLFANSSASSS